MPTRCFVPSARRSRLPHTLTVCLFSNKRGFPTLPLVSSLSSEASTNDTVDNTNHRVVQLLVCL